MANGKVVYPSGDPAAVTYVFPINFDFGHNPGSYLDTDDKQRSIDGTLSSFRGGRKKVYELSFTNVTKAQKDYFNNLWNLQCSMDLYLNGTDLDAVVKMSPPSPKSAMFFDSLGSELYSFSVVFEEI